MGELSYKLERYFSMGSWFTSNIVFGVKWYVGSGSPKHMISKKKAFYKLKEQEAST